MLVVLIRGKKLLNTKQKIMLARAANCVALGYRRLLGKSSTDVFVRRGIRWHLDLNEGIDFSIYLLGAFEPEAIPWYTREISKGAFVLDIGANIGAHTLTFAKLVGSSGSVVAFEPTDYAFSKLQKNIALNPDLACRISAFQVLLCAPGEHNQRPDAIYSSWPLASDASVHEVHGGKLQAVNGAQIATLDQIFDKRKAKRVDFIKIDVDGHELPVLKGASELLDRDKPTIFIELCPHVGVEHGVPFHELVKYIVGKGYSFYSVSGNLLPSDAGRLQNLIPKGGVINVFAKAK